MSFQDDIDFSKYGVNFDFNQETQSLPDSIKSNILPVVATKGVVKFKKNNGSEITMNLKTKLGAGSYGAAWTTNTELEKGVPLIVKIISSSHITNALALASYEYDIVQESVAQIIVYECTKDIKLPEINLVGPFAPKLFLIGKDNENFYIVSERMDGSVDSFLRGNTVPPTEFIKSSIVQLSAILYIVWKKIHFNHRDLKPDNIMYKVVDGHINVRLIDFGFSCLKYRNLVVAPVSNEVFASALHCDSSIRDMHGYLFYLVFYTTYKKFRCPLKRLINSLLVTDAVDLPKNWAKTYEEFNTYNTRDNTNAALNCSLDVVYNIFSELKFSTEVSCSNIDPGWTKHLRKLYFKTVDMLTDDEYANVRKEILDPFLVPYLKSRLETIWKLNKSDTIFVNDFKYRLKPSWYSCNNNLSCDRRDFFAQGNIISILFTEFLKRKLYLNTDATNETIFHKIAKNKLSHKAVEYLDSLLALNPPVSLLNIQSQSGKTALDIAVESRFTYAIEKLTPLTSVSLKESIMKVNIDLVKKALEDPGILISKKDSYGKTCLHYASAIASFTKGEQKQTAFEIVKLLLERYPALADIKDNEGKGPGNPSIATDPDVRKLILSAKSTFFKRNPNTEKSKRGAGRKRTRRRR